MSGLSKLIQATDALLSQAREDGILASRLAVRTQGTIDSLIDIKSELERLEAMAERKRMKA